METTLTLRVLGRLAGGGAILDGPIEPLYADLKAAVPSSTVLHHLVRGHGCRTLRAALTHPSADDCLREQMTAAGAAEFVRSIERWLLKRSLPTQGERGVPLPPVDWPSLRSWAAQHGVLERLADPAMVLASRIRSELRHLVRPNGHVPSIDHLLSRAATPPRSGLAVRERDGAYGVLAQAARAYLWDVARAAAEVRDARRALEKRARAPSEPSLRALAARFDATRAAIVRAGGDEQPLGTYRPRPVEMADEPLRLVYRQSTGPSHDDPTVTVEIVVGEEPLRPRCSCTRSGLTATVDQAGHCEHALAALDGAIDFLRDPLQGPAQQRLAAELGAPAWTRFLRALGDGLARTERAAAREDTRLAFKIQHHAGSLSPQRPATLTVEPVLQKALKRGGWSAGQRISLSDLAQRPELSRDPEDARVIAALTDGLEETGGLTYRTPSRARIVRALAALTGHPRAFLADQPPSGSAGPRVPQTPARIENARLRLLLEMVGDGAPPAAPLGAPPPDLSRAFDGGVTVTPALGDRRFRAAELAAAAGGTDHAIVVDALASTVVVCKLDPRIKALLAALEKFPARFPPESYDELLGLLQPLQESVDIELPEALRGEAIEPDRRVVVRLSPREDGPETEAALFVRPIAGGPLFRPGEGPAEVVYARGGRRVMARRPLAEEPDAAMEVVRSLPILQASAAADAGNLGSGSAGAGDDTAALPPFTWRLLDQESVLDLLAGLRALGDRVVVEWPEPDRKLEVASTALRRTLKLRITDKRDWFGVDGEVTVDGELVSFSALLEAVRSGRRYVEVGRHRFAAIEDELRRRLATAADLVFQGRHGLEVGLPGAGALADLVDDPGQLEAVVRWRDLVKRIDAAKALEPEVPAGLAAVLRPYQVEGFRWLARLAAWGVGACLADDMGLGKTVQALALLVARAPRGPALVIAPTSVGPNWIAEATRFAPGLRVQLYRGAGRAAMLASLRAGDLVVTSYGLATRDAEALAGVRFATLIVDEAQSIKNALTRRARAVRDLDAEFCVALTGTPVENHLGELWSLMRIVAPGLLGSWDNFRERFAAPIERGGDPERRVALARALRPFLLRRAKAEVAPELPARSEIARLVERSAAERRLYDEARRTALAAIASGEGDARFILLAALTRLRRLACHPRLIDDASTVPSSKLTALLEIVRELRETGHRALVFSQFTTHLALVREALDAEGITYAYLDGSTPSEERTRRIAAFQAGGSDLFLISLKAGGTGLNLTAADYVIHLDPWWNPAVEDQATDRAHRIGQTRAVTVIRLIARGTIEESVLALHGDKRALAAGVFDEQGGPAQLSADDLAALIRAGGDTAGEAERDDDDAGDALGAELLADDPPSRPRRSRQTPRPPLPVARPDETPPSAPPPAANATGVIALADRVLDHLAARKQVADRRYDGTLRAYERSLRRFADYVAAGSQEGALRADPDVVIDGYLAALQSGRWPAPASEARLAGTVMKHLRAFLDEEGRG